MLPYEEALRRRPPPAADAGSRSRAAGRRGGGPPQGTPADAGYPRSEQGGAPQCATNSPVDCWLARGRFPYGSPKHPALKGAGCFSLYPSGLGRRTGIEQLVPAVCSVGSPKQAPRRGQGPALRVPQTKIQIPETGKGREDSRPFLRVSSVPSLQRRNKKAVQVLNGLLNKKGVPHRGVPLFLVGHPLLTRALSDSPLDCRLTGCSSPEWPSE